MPAPVPNPGAGAVAESVTLHSLGGVLKAEQIVFKRLAESLAESAVVPFITRVGEP